MTPSPGAANASLPPLPDLQSAAGTGGAPGGNPGFMASLVAGIAPVKNAVDMILAGCKQIVQSGAVPGAEQPCAQIVALATSMLPMAAQAALQPGGGGPSSGISAPPGQGIPPMPSPQGPPSPQMGMGQ